MRHSKSYIFGIGLGLCAVCIAAGARAEPSHKAPTATVKQASEMAPEDIIRKIYADYMSGVKMPPGSSEDVIRPFASSALRKAIDQENRCKSVSGEICAIDFDCIIVGQDWGELFDFHTARLPTADGLNLQSRFREKDVVPNHHVVTYSFVKEEGAWRIDDVDDDGNWKLKGAIVSYFKEYDEHNNPRRTHK